MKFIGIFIHPARYLNTSSFFFRRTFADFSSECALWDFVARAIRNAMRARIDSRESFTIQTPIFIARQADSRESFLKKREGVPEVGTKPLKAPRGYRASNRGSNRGSKGSRKIPEALRGWGPVLVPHPLL